MIRPSTFVPIVLCLLSLALPAAGSESYTLFESGHVRPLALSPTGNVLAAVNTPDGRLEVFRVRRGRLKHLDSIPVGVEPVAVAFRDEFEIWVVNHVSDSVSVIEIGSSGYHGRVVRTLLVGDEPRDIVFAGPARRRAFITAAHRGQNIPFDPELTTAGVGRADVWIFDSNDLGDSLTGEPIAIVNLFADSPRALAVSPNGRAVYAAAHKSGNQTSVLDEGLPDLTLQVPTTDYAGRPAPPVGAILRYDGADWTDESGRVWNHHVNFNLPDKDVFTIDAMAATPVEVAGAHFTSVGTVLYNMAVNPESGKIYVSNTEALNINRFEGPGTFAGHTVRGNHNRHRVTVLASGGSVTPRHLNKHVDFDSCCAPPPNAESVRSLALPIGMAVTQSGQTLYVAALGSDKVGVFNTTALETDTFMPAESAQIPIPGGGPTAVVLDEGRGQMFVMARFSNSVVTIDLGTRAVLDQDAMFSPEPATIVDGRRVLYDATLSSHGDSACATCHVFGDNDDLAWDLGNPDADPLPNNNPILALLSPVITDISFFGMKGPLTTQSLRGMANHGPMHWRGDRTGSLTEPNIQPDSGAFDEREAFRQFQAGFEGLLGRPAPIPDEQMSAFTDFILEVMYPPNPNANLDGTLTEAEDLGRQFYFERRSFLGAFKCNDCHQIDPDGNREFGVKKPGFFGTQGLQVTLPFISQPFKIPHLRNAYTKVGMFGTPDAFLFELGIEPIPGQMGPLGDQIRGFGVSRPGTFDSVRRFHSVPPFSQAFPFAPNPEGFEPGHPTERLNVTAFVLSFPTNHQAIVGQQVTFDRYASDAMLERASLIVARGSAGDADVIAKGWLGHEPRGFVLAGGVFVSDQGGTPPVGTLDDLIDLVMHDKDVLTVTAVPLGSGYRLGVDRDDDGVLDGDE